MDGLVACMVRLSSDMKYHVEVDEMSGRRPFS